MENSIIKKEDKYIKDGYKQVYPNDKDIKVTLLNWVSDWVWICNAFQTRKLSLREAFKNKGSKFLDVEDDYEDTSNLQLRLTKNSQKQIYSISDIFITDDGGELIRLTTKTTEDYKGFVQKIDKIYFDINNRRLLIFLDKNFVSKKGEKIIAKKAKENEAKKSISELFE